MCYKAKVLLNKKYRDMNFSERYGYIKTAEVLKRGQFDKKDTRALCNCFDYLRRWVNQVSITYSGQHKNLYTKLEESIWCEFLNQRLDEFSKHRNQVVSGFLLSEGEEWFRKFDLVEFSIGFLRENELEYDVHEGITDELIGMVNDTFRRLSYAYRVVDDRILEITNEEEIATIEEAVSQNTSLRTHLSGALKQLSLRPEPDYRNSIKESISAVEVLCREITGASTLGDALKSLEREGIKIPTSLSVGFEKLYVYTNDKRTGIRHALLDASQTPGYEEAKFMLVACSAFINYIQGKRGVSGDVMS